MVATTPGILSLLKGNPTEVPFNGMEAFNLVMVRVVATTLMTTRERTQDKSMAPMAFLEGHSRSSVNTTLPTKNQPSPTSP